MAELEGLELVKAVAEHVMGWFDAEANPGRLEHPFFVAHSEAGLGVTGRPGIWNPLTSYNDAFEVVNAMRAKGYHYDSEDRGVMSHIRFCKVMPNMGGCLIPTKFEREGICIAALRALSQQGWRTFKEEMAFWERLGKRAALAAVKGEMDAD